MAKCLQPLQRITNGDMSQASLTSGVVDGRYLTNLKFQIDWAGAPVGALKIEESLDYNPQIAGSGTWHDNGAGITGPAGADGSALVNLLNRAPCFYRVVYTKSSGTGTLQVWASGLGF